MRGATFSLRQLLTAVGGIAVLCGISRFLGFERTLTAACAILVVANLVLWAGNGFPDSKPTPLRVTLDVLAYLAITGALVAAWGLI